MFFVLIRLQERFDYEYHTRRLHLPPSYLGHLSSILLWCSEPPIIYEHRQKYTTCTRHVFGVAEGRAKPTRYLSIDTYYCSHGGHRSSRGTLSHAGVSPKGSVWCSLLKRCPVACGFQPSIRSEFLLRFQSDRAGSLLEYVAVFEAALCTAYCPRSHEIKGLPTAAPANIDVRQRSSCSSSPCSCADRRYMSLPPYSRSIFIQRGHYATPKVNSSSIVCQNSCTGKALQLRILVTVILCNCRRSEVRYIPCRFSSLRVVLIYAPELAASQVKFQGGCMYWSRHVQQFCIRSIINLSNTRVHAVTKSQSPNPLTVS